MNDHNRLDHDSTSSESLAASAHNLAMHAEELLKSTASMSSEGIVALRQKLTESLRVAREQLGTAQSYAMARGKAAATATDNYVHEKPWQVIAAVALVGIVIGFMSRSPRR